MHVSSDSSLPSVKQEPTKALKEVPLPATLESMVFPLKEPREDKEHTGEMLERPLGHEY